MTDLGLILKQGLICKIVYRYQIKKANIYDNTLTIVTLQNK